MELKPKIFKAQVMHKRIGKQSNFFCYKVFYTLIPINQLSSLKTLSGLAINRKAFINFRNSDHGNRDGTCLQSWIDKILVDHDIKDRVDQIMLLTMPRVAGYVFNPISFWFCLDSHKNQIAVLCEVNNTFKQNHCYLCVFDEQPSEYLKAKKVFHVSPFFERKGYYQFRFKESHDQLIVEIDYYDDSDKLLLKTRLYGRFSELNLSNLLRTVALNPLITFKVIGLIHWQGLKLFLKGVKYIKKPIPLKDFLTRSILNKK